MNTKLGRIVISVRKWTQKIISRAHKVQSKSVNRCVHLHIWKRLLFVCRCIELCMLSRLSFAYQHWTLAKTTISLNCHINTNPSEHKMISFCVSSFHHCSFTSKFEKLCFRGFSNSLTGIWVEFDANKHLLHQY